MFFLKTKIPLDVGSNPALPIFLVQFGRVAEKLWFLTVNQANVGASPAPTAQTGL